MEINKSEENQNANDLGQVLAVMDVYLRELIHRDEIAWKQIFRFYTAALVIIVFPYTHLLKKDLELPDEIYVVAGILMLIMFFYVSYSYGVRLKAAADTYKNVSRLLPEEYRRLEIEHNMTSFHSGINKHLSITIPVLMGLSLLAMIFITYVMAAGK